MSRVTIVGGMLGDTLDLVTTAGLAALKQADVVLYPGEWIGETLRRDFGDRLLFGREIGEDRVRSVAAQADSLVILYGGDASLFTGRPGRRPDARKLAQRLEDDGHAVTWITGASTAQHALALAGLSLETCPSAALTIAAPLCCPGHGAQELHKLATSNATLALFWAEDRSTEAWSILRDARGPTCRAWVIRAMGQPEQEVYTGSLAELKPVFDRLTPAAVVLVAPPIPTTPPTLIEHASKWMSSISARVVWVLGPPGAGKSTWLRAASAAVPSAHVVELGEMVSSVAWTCGTGQGGLQALGHAAAMVTQLARQSPADVRWLVAATSLPDWALERADDETVYLLCPDAVRLEAQYRSRTGRSSHTASRTELEMHLRAAAHLRDLGLEILDIPFDDRLLGAPSP